METAESMVDRALGRVAEVTQSYPSSRGPMYVRLGFRQRQLLAVAAKLNPERYGVCAVSALQTATGKRVVDLNDISGSVPVPELVQRVEVEDGGTSPYAAGTEVTIVTMDDQEAELPPRALLRDGIIIGVGTDLDLVTSLEIFYSRLPALLAYNSTNTSLDLDAPWDTLLEIDLARWLVGKATGLADDVRIAALKLYESEEKELMAMYTEHCAQFAPSVSRFLPPRVVARG